MKKTVKLSVKQLRTLIENTVKDAQRKKQLREKLELGRMGAEHGGLMSFDEWEAGAATADEDVVNHMRQQHAGEKKSEMQWAKLYNQYEEAMQNPVF